MHRQVKIFFLQVKMCYFRIHKGYYYYYIHLVTTMTRYVQKVKPIGVYTTQITKQQKINYLTKYTNNKIKTLYIYSWFAFTVRSPFL